MDDGELFQRLRDLISLPFTYCLRCREIDLKKIDMSDLTEVRVRFVCANERMCSGIIKAYRAGQEVQDEG